MGAGDAGHGHHRPARDGRGEGADRAGGAAGSLSAEEIAVALGDLEVDAGTVDDFYRALEEMQIDVVGRGR